VRRGREEGRRAVWVGVRRERAKGGMERGVCAEEYAREGWEWRIGEVGWRRCGGGRLEEREGPVLMNGSGSTDWAIWRRGDGEGVCRWGGPE
jgi:hypothetical protein